MPLSMTIFEEMKGDYRVSTDKSLLDFGMIHQYLSQQSYWAKNIPLETVQRAIDHSLCFGIYEKNKQVGFCRVVSDQAIFAYLADVFVLEDYRGKGLALWMIRFVLTHPDLQGLRRWTLATRDAHGLYLKAGFTVLAHPERWMHINHPDMYMTPEKPTEQL